MMNESETPDGANENTEQGQEAPAQTNTDDVSYLKSELKKVIGQRDALKAEKRDRDAQESDKAEAARQEAMSLEEQLKESREAYAKLRADIRTDAIHRELLAGVPEEHKEAVLTIYTANEIGLNEQSLTPAEVAAKGRDLIGKMAPVLMAQAAAQEPAQNTKAKPEPKQAQKLTGQRAGESADEHLRPDVRKAKAEAAFRKKFPGFGNGMGL